VAVVALAWGVSATPVRAQEQVLEEVERQDRVQASGAVVTVLEREELERHQWRTLADVLEHVPGLHVSTAGGEGHPSELSVRGSSQHQTLFLLDGIELEDPAQLHDAKTSSWRSSGTAIPHLLIDDLERIEVWRGPQSAHFGSGAMGGVVRLITRRGGGDLGVSAWSEVGAFGTSQSALRLRGGTDRIDYTASYTAMHTRGISSAEEDTGGHERDGYDNSTLASRVDIELTPDLRLGLVGRFVNTENELDLGARRLPGFTLQPFPSVDLTGRLVPGDTRAQFGSTRQLFGRAEAELRLLDGRWRQTLAVNLSDHAAREKERPTELRLDRFVTSLSGIPFPERLTADGERLQVGWRHELELSRDHTLALGVETERETFDSSQKSDALVGVPTTSQRSGRERTNALFAEERFQLGPVGGVIAGRLDDRSDLETQPSGLLAVEYPLLELGTRLHASLGSAFRVPALDVEAATVHRLNLGVPAPRNGEVVAVVPGALDPDAERSYGWDFGVQQSFWDRLAVLDVTYFQGRTRNVEIDRSVPVADPASALAPVDSGELAVEGVESVLELRPVSPLEISLYHTYTRAEEKSATFRRGSDRLLQPKHELGARIGADFLQGTSFALDVRYVGSRKDLREPASPFLNGLRTDAASTTSVGGYTVVDLAASHTFLQRYSVFARVENLFDREYSDERYVGQPGIAGYVGVRVEF